MTFQRHNFLSYSFILIFLLSLFSAYRLGHADEANPLYSSSSLWKGKLRGFSKPLMRTPADHQKEDLTVLQGTTTSSDDDDDGDEEECPALPPGSETLQLISVDDFGAKGDGSTDDTEAFEKAWEQACSSAEGATLVVAKEKSYRLKPIKFTGPCKSAGLNVQIYGSLEASDDRSDYEDSRGHWLVFDSVDNLEVGGGGTIDGKGKIWWENSCKTNKNNPCTGAPTALTFRDNQQLMVKNLTIQNAQQMHLTFQGCEHVKASNLVVSAPGNSPNTDGIHVTSTHNILISTSTIGTGDDCISIVSGSEKVQIQDIACGPGHGISIGSLGKGNSEAHVSGVTVNGAKLSGTTNGLRIKTWQGGSGSANNIIFQNVEMNNVTNPIIIDQNYCDQDESCKEQPSAVQVQNVVYQEIQGSSASDVAIKFDCSESHPCEGITLENVDLKGEDEDDEAAATATCNNVHVTVLGTVYPGCSTQEEEDKIIG